MPVKTEDSYLPDGYRRPTDKERRILRLIYTKIVRIRKLITLESSEQKKKLIRRRRDLTGKMINYLEKNKIYYIPEREDADVKQKG